MAFPISISLPRSKSIVIRCLIIDYLKTGKLLPVFSHDPNDIHIVFNALKAIDANKKTSVDEECAIDVEDCGAAYRFLMALLAATKGKWILTGTDRLLQRPILPLVFFLRNKGAKIEKSENGWLIEGRKLQIDNLDIETDDTSQYASAIMMINVKRRIDIKEKGEKENAERNNDDMQNACSPNFPSYFEGMPVGQGSLYKNPYIKMTAAILNCDRDFINRVSTFSDWGAAAFWIANALLVPNAHYLLKDLHFDGLQGDAEMVRWFAKWGLLFTENETGIEVKHEKIMDIHKQNINVAQTPDTAMIFGVLSVCYPFELMMSGLKNLNLKESKRLDILVTELSNFTRVEKHSEDVITIYKRTEELPNSFHLDSYNDHRFVMAWSLFKNYGTVKIQNAECVKKSYPGLM
jgi:3-phosphoshikimate 1-carboxyvinyltransferase